jgi:hypothetical protein
MFGQPIAEEFVGDLKNNLALVPRYETNRRNPGLKILPADTILEIRQRLCPQLTHNQHHKVMKNYDKMEK